MRAALCALAAGVFAVAAAAAQEPVTAAAVEGWADDLFAEALAGRRLSGAVVTVVSRGEIIFEKGYGYADWRAQTAIDPARTMFRIGSATKTFTAVAIEQLIESGAIASLDDSANLYLKRIKLPAAEGREITLRDLATHRAGYADRTFGIASNDSYAPPLSASAIGAHLPPLVRAPGERVVYSNFGSAMLGVVVEDVTTTGGSAIKAAETLRAEGAEVLCVVTVVDRQEGAGEAFDAAGLRLVPILTLEDFK